VFKRLHSKYLQGVEKSTKKELGKDSKLKRRGGKSRVTRSYARIEEQKKEICNRNSQVMWTEKYKPTSVDDLVGNRHSIDQLKHWLESWKHCSDEVQHRVKESGRKRKGKGI
jgi:replication factor C subunit 1